ncbi:Putative transcriptional regulator, MerR family [Mycobacteroides abscessus subsp. abscessus]|nr:Putative transcriptional regulator, MerR family [Mycobacteroides abscessus subsp. abscessus]
MSTSEPSHAGFPISHVAQRTGLSSFSDDDIERVQLMLRLRRTGMPVRDMRRFIELLAGGEETHAERLELLFAQRVRILAAMERLTEDLRVVDFKVAYYTESVNGASAQSAGGKKN